MNIKEFERGYNSADKEINKGENALELLNQCRSSLTNDDFDKGWKERCKQNL